MDIQSTKGTQHLRNGSSIYLASLSNAYRHAYLARLVIRPVEEGRRKLWLASHPPTVCAMPQYSQTGDDILMIFIGLDTIARIDTTAQHYFLWLINCFDAGDNWYIFEFPADSQPYWFSKAKIWYQLIRITWELHTLTVIKLLVLLLIKWELHPLKYAMHTFDCITSEYCANSYTIGMLHKLIYCLYM